MALSTNDIKKKYPLPINNYRVSIMSLNPDLSNIETITTKVGCSKIEGLSMESEIVPYKHGLSFVTGINLISGKSHPVKLSIHKGITRDGNYFSDWMQLSYPQVKPMPLGLFRKRDMFIDLCDEEGLPLIRWTILKAVPIKLVAPTFNAANNDVAFEQLDLIAQEMTVVYNP